MFIAWKTSVVKSEQTHLCNGTNRIVMKWKCKCLTRSHLLPEQSSHAQQQLASPSHRMQCRNYHPGSSGGQRTWSILNAMKQRALLGHLPAAGLPTRLADPGRSRMVDSLESISLVGPGRSRKAAMVYAVNGPSTLHIPRPFLVGRHAGDCQPKTGFPIDCLAAGDPTRCFGVPFAHCPDCFDHETRF